MLLKQGVCPPPPPSKKQANVIFHPPYDNILTLVLSLFQPAAGQSNIFLGEEPVKTSKKMHDQKFAELTGNDIFKDDAPPGLAEKHMSHSRAKLKEMAGSDIFADGKAENRDNILGARKERAGSDIFTDGKAENRNNILGARRPPGGGSSISLV